MVTREDLESWLSRLDSGALDVKEVQPGLWLARTSGGGRGGGALRAPRGAPAGAGDGTSGSEPRRGELYRQLLELNARDLVHGSYGLEGDHVVLTDTLELENLDYNEFEASFDSMTLALASHLGALAPYREK